MSGFFANVNDTPRVLNVTSTATTSLNLANVDYVWFNTAGAGTISTFTNVIVGKTYTLYNFNAGVWTINRTAAHLPGGANVALSITYILQVVGDSATSVNAASPVANNS